MIIAIAFASCGSSSNHELSLEDLNSIYNKAYDDDEYWREFGYGSSSSDSLALKLAKNDAYNALLLKALDNIYPQLFLNYDKSILDNDNIVYDTIIKKNKNDYEAYVALEIPIEVMEKTIKAAIESILVGYGYSYPPEPIYISSFEENIDCRIKHYKFKKE